MSQPYMPEHALTGLFGRQIGLSRGIVFEPNVSYLATWDNVVRLRRGLSELPRPTSRRLVDMAKLEPLERVEGKVKRDLFAQAEFKAGWLSVASQATRQSDWDKLLEILPLIDTCPWGIVCGWVDQGIFARHGAIANGDRCTRRHARRCRRF
jgi:hypothetical protein